MTLKEKIETGLFAGILVVGLPATIVAAQSLA